MWNWPDSDSEPKTLASSHVPGVCSDRKSSARRDGGERHAGTRRSRGLAPSRRRRDLTQLSGCAAKANPYQPKNCPILAPAHLMLTQGSYSLRSSAGGSCSQSRVRRGTFNTPHQSLNFDSDFDLANSRGCSQKNTKSRQRRSLIFNRSYMAR